MFRSEQKCLHEAVFGELSLPMSPVCLVFCCCDGERRMADKFPCKCRGIIRVVHTGDVGFWFSDRRHAEMIGLFVVILSPLREMLLYGACEQHGSAVF